MSYLLFIHIGPVQEFIAAARRTRDLWFGSWLLSELAKAAALSVTQDDPTALIFPSVYGTDELKPGSDLDAPNKIVAVIEGDPKVVAERAKDALCDRIRGLRDEAFGMVSGDFSTDIADQQLDGLPEFYWVAVPLPDHAEYPTARKLGEQLLAARKNTRAYSQPEWASNAPKSSIDGRLEAVIDESVYPEPSADDKEKRKKQRTLYDRYRISGGERLSGVDLFKRFGRRNAKGNGTEFPSTSHIAALPAVTSLVKNHKKAWNTFVDALGKVDKSLVHSTRLKEQYDFGADGEGYRIDASVLFTGRLEEQAEELGIESTALTALLEALWGEVEELPRNPLPYYAILVGDGDDMGLALSGMGSEGHRAFSQALSKFAGEVAETIEKKHNGAVVYAGGDDVLALLPLHRAIEAAADVATLFRDTMADHGRPTFSAGLAIAHFMEPLSDSLRLARSAEQRAKAVSGKNALAITVSKRSGADRPVVGKWGEVDAHLLKLAELHRAEEIPDGAAYQMQDVLMELGGQSAVNQRAALQEIARLEAQRILNRKRAERGERKLTEEVSSELRKLLGRGSGDEVSELTQLLIVSKLFADAKDEACEPLQPKMEENVHG